MKKYLLLMIMALCISLPGIGQILYEDFNYAPPAYIGGNGAAGTNSNYWTTHSVTAGQTTTIDIASGNLSYPGLTTSTGNMVYFFSNANATSRDINRAFTPTGTPTVMYCSFLINILDNAQIGTSYDYCFSFGATAGSAVPGLGARFGVKSVNAGANFRFGISNISGGTPTYTEDAVDRSFGTTYLVVVKYDRGVSPTVAYLWVNPASLGGAEPAGSLSNATGTNTFNAFASVCLRNNATSPKANIDEIRVGEAWADVTPTGAPPSATITVDPDALTGFTYMTGNGPSPEQSFSISGTSLTENISVTAPADYEISTGTGGTFVHTSPITLNRSGSTVPATPIYVRLKAGLAVNTYNGEVISAASGTASATVTCNGSVTATPIPSLTLTPSALTGFKGVFGTPSPSKNYTVSGDNLTSGVTITAPALYEVSTDDVAFGTEVVLPQSGGNITGEPVTIYTRIRASAPFGAAAGDIAHVTAGTATVNVNVTGVVIYGEPSNHADAFTAVSPGFSSITTTWLDNIGTQPTTGFLILANKTGIFTEPADGVPVTNDNSLNDGIGAMNLPVGVQTYTWTGLSSSTQFYFAIYAYSNTLTDINYKLIPAAPTTNVFTQVFVNPTAAWTFDAASTPAKPNTPIVVPSNFGDQAATAVLYADGTNGSSLFACTLSPPDTELDAFTGALTNDPREGTAAAAGNSYVPAGGTGMSANGKSMVIKYSMSALQDPILTFATRGTSTGFNNHQWAWSTDGLAFVDFGTNTAVITSTFLVKTLDMSAINALDGAPVVYLRITFTGASSSTGNNRLDNIVIRASAATNLAPTVFTTAATNVGANAATLNGTVNANNQTTTVKFAYGLTTAYGDTVAAVPPTVSGGLVTPVSFNLTGLMSNATYHYKVIGTNGSGSSVGQDFTFTTTCLLPGDPGAITGPATVCANLTPYVYSTTPIDNVTYYFWSFPPGANITLGEGTTSVTVTFAPGNDPGNVNVYGTNDCGDESNSSQLLVSVDQPLPVSVSIVESANPVPSGTWVTFTATPVNGGATPAYQWKVNGANAGTNSATFQYIPTNNDEISCVVTSNASCTSGSPATSNTIVMSVTGIPADLTVTGTVSPGPAVCYNATNTITVAGGATSFSVLSGGNATFIAGQKIFFMPGTTVLSGGYMLAKIAPSGPYCTPPPAAPMLTGQEESGINLTGNTFRIYPNPTSGQFTIEQTGNKPADHVKVEVIGTVGGRILSTELSGFTKHELSIRGNAPGIYFVKITSEDKSQTVKIILTN